MSAPPPAAAADRLWLPYTPMQGGPPPVEAAATEGVRIELADGRRVIDGVSSWWTACHGYNHPHILGAVADQLARMPHVMFGGILGMGETREDRAAMLATLAGLDPPPESVPINMLVRSPGTPLAQAPDFDPLEFVRTVAAARVMMPASMLRLSAGRLEMPEPVQALCFLAGANSIFAGEKLLTTPNPDAASDYGMFARLGIRPDDRDRRTP